MQHFTDRFKVNNQYVHYWNFIRGRELAGMIPWYFNLPADTSNYNAAWKHVIDTSQLLGKFGFAPTNLLMNIILNNSYFPGPARQPVEWPKLALSNKPGHYGHG